MVLIKYSNLTTTAMKQFLTAIALALLLPLTGLSAAEPSFRALVLTERGGQHESFTAAALEWLDGFARENNFTYEEINSPRDIDSAFLARFKVFIQLDYPPYNWPDKAKRPLNRLSSTERLDGWDFTTLRFWATSTASPCGNGSRTSWVAYASKTT